MCERQDHAGRPPSTASSPDGSLWSLVVEVDGGRYHATRAAREDDHDRDAELVLAGWRVLRFADSQLDHDEPAVIARVARAASR